MRKKPTFTKKPCASCGEDFLPTGPSQKRHSKCQEESHKERLKEYQLEYSRRSKRKKQMAEYAKGDKRRSYTRLYNRTAIGKIRNTYAKMKARVEGRHKSSMNYKGLPICSLDRFIEFSLNDNNFTACMFEWEKNKYSLDHSPSINRRKLMSPNGYQDGNMEWIPFWLNSSEK